MSPNGGAFPLLVLAMVFAAGIFITVGVVWAQNRTKMKAIDVLRHYAERGQEPPQGVLDAINRVNWPPGVGVQPPPQTRGQHLSHVASCVVLSIGAAGIAWWRYQLGDTGGLMVLMLVIAIFFAGGAAARLVAALTTRDGN